MSPNFSKAHNLISGEALKQRLTRGILDSEIKEREGKTENSVNEEDDHDSLKNRLPMPNSYREQADLNLP